MHPGGLALQIGLHSTARTQSDLWLKMTSEEKKSQVTSFTCFEKYQIYQKYGNITLMT